MHACPACLGCPCHGPRQEAVAQSHVLTPAPRTHLRRSRPPPQAPQRLLPPRCLLLAAPELAGGLAAHLAHDARALREDTSCAAAVPHRGGGPSGATPPPGHQQALAFLRVVPSVMALSAIGLAQRSSSCMEVALQCAWMLHAASLYSNLTLLTCSRIVTCLLPQRRTVQAVLRPCWHQTQEQLGCGAAGLA